MFALPLRDGAELRPLEPHHADQFAAHMDRAREHIAPWVGAGFLSDDLDGARKVLQGYADGRAADRRRLYGIWSGGVLVGGTMFVDLDAAAGTCEIGCWLEPAAEGRGLVAPAVRLMVDWAFRERGLTRADWRTLPGNERSIRLAERLGFTRREERLWSVHAAEWPEPTRPPGGVTGDKAELDRLMGAFLGAFTTTGGRRPDLDAVRRAFLPEGIIVKNAGGETVRYDVEGFIAPRERILTDGTLTGFAEWEVAERTEVFGSVAHRFSEYRKSGFWNGTRFEGGGYKTTQFVRTGEGWRISALAWDDV